MKDILATLLGALLTLYSCLALLRALPPRQTPAEASFSSIRSRETPV